MAAFDITVTSGLPEASVSEDGTIMTMAVPIVLPLGDQATLLGVVRFQLDKHGAEQTFRKGLEQIKDMKDRSQIEIATDLGQAEKAAHDLSKMKGEG